MLPKPDKSMMNPHAEARFKTLQTAVCLVRVAREKRKIRNNLPLKSVLVVSSDEKEIEALGYLRSYFLSEINAWDCQLTTELKKYCVLKTQPNWKDLGKRMGKQMKDASKAIAALTHEDILNFMSSGKITVCGFDLTSDDIVVKREFAGDAKRFESAVSEDGLLVAVDTLCDEEVLMELRARTFSARVQKLRKAGGLVSSDRVEVFFEETESSVLLPALSAHATSTVKRIRSLPLPASLKAPWAKTIISETVTDEDLSQQPIKIILSFPSLSVSASALRVLTKDKDDDVALLGMYLGSMDYERACGLAVIKVNGYELVRGLHYFASTADLLNTDTDLQQQHAWYMNRS